MQAIGENILVLRPRQTERRQGSIIIPNNAADQEFFVAEIISVGTDIEDSKLMQGTTVLVNNFGMKTKLGDKTEGEVFRVLYDDIITVVEDGEV